MKNKKLFSLQYSILIFVSSCLFPACSNEKAIPQPARKEAPPVTVEVAKVQYLEFPSSNQFTGKIASEKQVNLSTKLMGTITYLDVKEGQSVRVGKVIAKIKSSDLEIKKARVLAQKQEALAALANAEKNLARFKILKDQNSATQKEVDDLQTQAEMSRARIESINQMENEIKDALSYSNVTAPFSGRIIKKHLNQGDIAAPGIPIVTLENESALKAMIDVPESFIANVKIGNQVNLVIDALGSQSFPGKIDRINTSGNGQYEAIISFKSGKASKALKSGMYVKAIFSQGNNSTLAIPNTSLIKRGQLTGVYTVGPNEVSLLRWIRTGRSDAFNTTVLSGLKADETIIVKSEGRLTNGRKIRLKETDNK